ncbi:deacylase [Winogradskyella sp. PC-19]|uniref:acyloxyacyl hydrolase n=1 Tax=unclassified Winogradskyella TaxID=2615021 RepID=UPI000B3CDA6B|nr:MULTISPECIES: acyloxyacyl hydrolase [unclassified Winogradskyella]ARV09355.1 deacylase [Winogradskyella sp. PC-19]RZN74432.1 MAG: acyloxyacyl hydrolase [Winogradskyella sp.]
MQIRLVSLFLFLSIVLTAQEEDTESYFDANYFKGYIALHDNNLLGLINGRPDGVILSWNKKTFGQENWEQRYNYPDYGASFIYQDLKSRELGDNFGVYGHYNFYFFNRNLMFRIGQGIGYTSNPYDRESNPKNIAFGSSLLSSTYVMLNYKKERIFDHFGLQAGFSLIHYSNANVKAPNTSVNTIALNVGVTYDLDEENPEYIHDLKDEKFTEPIKYNFAFRSGINQSDIIGSGQYPFYIFSAYVDKRINRKSAIQFGADVFFSNFLKELIRYESTAALGNGVTGDEDYKRIGIFAGHELFVNNFSLETQFGYYIYYPFNFESRTYIRAGLKRYFDNKWFAALTLKSHGFRAEAVELGIGLRL